MTQERHDPWALLREAHSFVDPYEGDLFERIHAALAAHEAVPPGEDRLIVAHRDGMDRMQQAIIDLLNEHNAPLHLIAHIVEMEYP